MSTFSGCFIRITRKIKYWYIREIPDFCDGINTIHLTYQFYVHEYKIRILLPDFLNGFNPVVYFCSNLVPQSLNLFFQKQ